MDIKVRNYCKEDLEGVNKVLYESFSCSKEDFSCNDFFEIVALVDGKIGGYLLLTKVFNPIKKRYYFLVDYVCVLSDYRGHGIGDLMLLYAEEVAREEKGMYLQLTCSHFRKAAHKLYERQGYKKRDSDIYRKELV